MAYYVPIVPLRSKRLPSHVGGLAYDTRKGIYMTGRRGDTKSALLSSIGCKECCNGRTGMSWMGQSELPGGVPATPPSIFDTSPLVLPFPTMGPSPVPVPSGLPVTVASQPPNIPLGPGPYSARLPALLMAAAGPAILPKPAVTTSWLDGQTIAGVSNKWLVIVAAGIVGLAAIAGKRR